MKWAVSQKGRLTAVSEPVIVALSLVKDDDFTIKRDASNASNKKASTRDVSRCVSAWLLGLSEPLLG